jgi:hypothetical protein
MKSVRAAAHARKVRIEMAETTAETAAETGSTSTDTTTTTAATETATDQKQVPLSALQEERKKRQDLQARIDEIDAKSKKAEAAELEKQGKFEELAKKNEQRADTAQAELLKYQRKDKVRDALLSAGVSTDRLKAATAVFNDENAGIADDGISAAVKTFMESNGYFKAQTTETVHGGTGHKGATGGGDSISDIQTKLADATKRYHDSDGHDIKAKNEAIRLDTELSKAKKASRSKKE